MMICSSRNSHLGLLGEDVAELGGADEVGHGCVCWSWGVGERVRESYWGAEDGWMGGEAGR